MRVKHNKRHEIVHARASSDARTDQSELYRRPKCHYDRKASPPRNDARSKDGAVGAATSSFELLVD